MADWGPFLTYWGSYCKNTIMGSDSRIRFSEGLLRTLYYETDVGSIPRGIMLDSRGMRPKFSDNEDWGKQIQGCYWCLDDNSDLNGVCCGRECLYFLHEWCIERAVHFTRDRFCRFPGCDKMTYNHNIYCNEEHRTKFDCAFAKWTDSRSTSLKSIIRAGPTWYRQDSSNNSATSSKSSTQPQSKHGYNLRRSSSSANNSNQSKSTEVKFGGNFPLEFRDILVLKTDIGIIPRKFPTREDLTSKFSQCPNWSAEIKGCHYCGKLEMKNPLYNHFCRLRCYLIFYEWCRTKVESMAKIDFCRYPECPRKASVGFQCCNKEHTIKINELYSENKITNINQAISVAPKWYTKSSTPHELLPHLFSQSQTNDTYDPPMEITEGNTNDNLIIEESRSLPKPDISQNVNLIPANTPRPKNELNTNDATYSSLYDPFNSSNLDIIPDEAKYQLPADYICPFDIPQTDNMDTELGIPSSRFPTLPTKLITPIDAEASEGIHTQLATTDKVARSNTINTRSNLRLQKSQSLIERNPQQNITLPDIYPFSLSTQLINTLSQHTDVGVIPRHRATRPPAPRELSPLTNWGAEIAGCYWCQLSNTSFHELTCGRRCWLLFHEWCVRKTESSSGARLCALPGCENSRASGCACCSLEHIGDLTELRGRAALSTEDEVELILGPSWYSDLSPIHFSRTGAFYEFSNNFPSLLLLEGSIWPTVYHYLCARKLVGTPYSNHILRMECVKELEMWMKRRTCAKWARADWSGVWEGDTYRAVLAKFQQNSVLRGLLLRTGRRPLVCRDSSLGDVLVGLRERFKTQRFFPAAQPEASIDSVCRYINNPGIVSKTSLTPSQDRVTEFVPTITSVKSIQIPINKDSQPVVATRCRSDSNSDSD